MKRIAVGFCAALLIIFSGLNSQASVSKTTIDLFWEQMLVFGQLAHDDFSRVSVLKQNLEELHNPSLTKASPLTVYKHIEKIATRFEWSFIIKQQNLEKKFEQTIKELACSACALELVPNDEKERALMKSFYEYVIAFSAKDGNPKRILIKDNASALEYLQEICLELKDLRYRIEHHQSPFLSDKIKHWLWGSEFSYEYLPLLIKGGFGGLYFFKLGTSVTDQVGLLRSLCEDMPIEQRNSIANKLWWALYINTGYTITSALISLACDSYRSLQKEAYTYFQEQKKERLTKQKVWIDQKHLTPLSFDDIIGNDSVKERLAPIVRALKNPLKLRALGGCLPKGILINGPDGVGKTLLARGLAQEAGCAFFAIKSSELVGDTQAVLDSYFSQASLVGPSIVCIDEIEVITGPCGPVITQDHNQTLACLLTYIDTFYQANPYRPVFIIAITNQSDVLDHALVRSGSFEDTITLDLPCYDLRRELLKKYLSSDLKNGLSINLNELATSLEGCSCRDVETVVNTARLKMINAGRVALSGAFLQESIDLMRTVRAS